MDAVLVLVSPPSSALADHVTSASLVHKRQSSEQLIENWSMVGPNRFELTARWRTHEFYGGGTGVFDTLIALETLRQSAILICHTGYATPIDHHFVMSAMSLSGFDGDAVRYDQPVRVSVACRAVGRRNGILAAAEVRVSMHQGNHLLATGTGDLKVVPPAVYRQIRGGAAASHITPTVPGLDPVLVGRMRDSDVVVASAPFSSSSSGPARARFVLRPDTRHPVLFDHALDHVPGMLLFEAARQADQAVSHASLILHETAGRFASYVELDEECDVVVRSREELAPGEWRTIVDFRQAGRVAATITQRTSANTGDSGSDER